MSTTDFEPSLLGTKDHWDRRYAQDLVQFQECGLEGEVWFGEEPVAKMVDWSLMHVPPSTHPNVLDVGTGNGHLLFALVEAGYDATRLMGIDYSQGSVDLCISIAKQRDELEGAEEVQEEREENEEAGGKKEGNRYARVTFTVCDFLDPASPVTPPGEERESEEVWDVILDKGTYDAISLMEKDERGMAPLQHYVPRVVGFLRPGGYFLITSCNFTEDELTQKIASPGSELEYKGSVPYKTFSFGGKCGSSYATVAFQKQSASVRQPLSAQVGKHSGMGLA